MQRRYEERKRMGLVGKLAAVAAVCLFLRFAAEVLEGPILFSEGAFTTALAAELPGGTGEGTDLGTLALMLELPGGLRISQTVQSEPEPEELTGQGSPEKTETPPAAESEMPGDPPRETEPSGGGEEPEMTENNAVGTTITGAGAGYERGAEGIYLKNKTTYDIDVEGLLQKPLDFSAAEGAQVLILHTHGSEAYTPDGDDIYVPSDPSRTEDRNYNVVRLGDELERLLTEAGVTVIHDRELYDYPSYNGSYNRALEAIQEHLKETPGIRVVIDLHRDALEGTDGAVYKTVADIGDTPCAQVMLVCGTNYSGLKHDNWQENLSFALKIQSEMVTRYPTLARPLNITQYRYNMHATTGSLIVEVGTNGNTLQEALTAVRYFAECLAAVLLNG